MGERPPYANCSVAQDAVAGTSGKDIPGSINNIQQAFAHAKTCKTCNDVLGKFLQDLIKELGVKLPSVNKLNDDQEPDYNAAESTETSKDVGPGTIGFDISKSGAPYKLKPTVSSLALSVAELEAKCRLKDAMIQAMADEFRHLSHCANWSGADLVATVAETSVSGPKVDFDRRALCNYLSDKPPHSLYPTQEEEADYKKTNPLGLRVVRQVGPDSLLVEWDAPPPGKVFAFEIYVNGLFAQRVRSSWRTKAILHPVDLSSKIFLTLNALAYTGETCENATIPFTSR